jgi:hypothetical protein
MRKLWTGVLLVLGIIVVVVVIPYLMGFRVNVH